MTDPIVFIWETEPVPVPVLHVQGRIDSEGANEFHETVLAFLKEPGQKNLVVDLAQVDFVASTGLATFLLVTEEFSDIEGSIVFANATPAVIQVILLLNIEPFLKLERTVEDAFGLLTV